LTPDRARSARDGLRVAFLGPAGTYTDEALRASAAEVLAGEPFEEAPMPTVLDAVLAVERAEAERAVVPIENALEGGVAATLDALAVDAPGVRITAEVVLPVSHCLIAREVIDLGTVERVLSHPQATAQCARFLRERLPEAELVAAGSTADAVRTVRDSGGPWAALGSRLAATLYDCEVLAGGVEDHPDNRTRFVWLAPEGAEAPPGDGAEKTSIVFWGAGDESPGWLVEVLSELSERSINLTKIESRPRRVALGHYMFFADLDGGLGEEAVADALAALRERVETLRVLGSYRAFQAA
jgi:prephenate dehydratase